MDKTTPTETAVQGADMPKTVVGVALVDDAAAPTTLLAGRRSAPAAMRGLWEFPGGKVEPGEHAREALHRELAEELGIEVELGAEVLAPQPEGWPLANGARMRVFVGVLAEGSPEPAPLEDHDLLHWCDLEHDALHALDWIPADRPIVDALLGHVADSGRGRLVPDGDGDADGDGGARR